MNPVGQIRQETHKLRHIRRSMMRAACDTDYCPTDLELNLEEIALHIDHINSILDEIADEIQTG